jgi:hypothetical protein
MEHGAVTRCNDYQTIEKQFEIKSKCFSVGLAKIDTTRQELLSSSHKTLFNNEDNVLVLLNAMANYECNVSELILSGNSANQNNSLI